MQIKSVKRCLITQILKIITLLFVYVRKSTYIAIELTLTKSNIMKKLKKFKATYSKQFEAETEDAVRIAKLIEPSGTKLEQVKAIESNLHPIFEDICECFNPIKNAKLLKEYK